MLCSTPPPPHPQIALIDLLNSMGLRPDGIIGHSLGEVACGYADGCLSQEEAILAAYWRGQCIKEANIPPGTMAAVGGCPPMVPHPVWPTALRVSREVCLPSTPDTHAGQRWGPGGAPLAAVLTAE